MILNLKQQINLFQPLAQRGPPLSFEHILMTWLGLILIFIMMIAVQKWELATAMSETALLNQRQQEINEKLANISVKKKLVNAQPKEQNPLVLIAKEIENTEYLINLLTNDKKQKQVPLSATFEGLMLTHVKGTFLSYIHATENNNQMSFTGVALKAQLVPMMLESWQKIPSFKNMKFNKVNFSLSGEKTPWVQFDLQAHE